MGSFIIRTSVTAPNMPKYSLNFSEDVCQLSPPTNSLAEVGSSPVGVDLPESPLDLPLTRANWLLLLGCRSRGCGWDCCCCWGWWFGCWCRIAFWGGLVLTCGAPFSLTSWWGGGGGPFKWTRPGWCGIWTSPFIVGIKPLNCSWWSGAPPNAMVSMPKLKKHK